MLARSGRDAAAVVACALDAEINAVEIDASDDALIELLGEIIARDRRRHDLHVLARVTSLVPFDLPSPHVHADDAYPGHHIRAQTESLLARLGVERLAVQQIHAWCPEWQDEGDWHAVLAALRDEGKIAGIGVSLFDHDVDAGLDIVASGWIDTVQVMVNLFDQGAIATLLPLCAAHDVGVIARSPLYYGALARGVRVWAEGDWRGGYFFDEHAHETTARVARIEAAPGETVADVALRFCASQPAVASVAVGMTTGAQVAANAAAMVRGGLGPARCAALARHAWLC